MKRIALVTILFLLIIFLSNSLIASALGKDFNQEEKAREVEKAIFMATGSQNRTLRIGLVDCIIYALKNNTEILIKRIEPQIKEDDIKIAQAEFKPTLGADFNLHDNTQISSSTLTGANVSKYRDIDINAGLTGKLATGTEYEFDFLNERYKSNSGIQSINPYYAVEPKITITQPLFKGFGTQVNKADIFIAQNNKIESQNSLKDKTIEIVTKAKSSYYYYVLFMKAFDIELEALERATSLLESNRARYDKGLISSVDLLETESNLADRQKVALISEGAVKTAEDNLKVVTNLVDDPEIWNADIQLIDMPEFNIQEVDLLESLEAAFKYRPDYNSALIDLKNRDIKITVAKNSTLPTLDLVGSFGLNGLGADYGKAIRKVDTDYKDWSIGVTFSLSLDGKDQAKLDQTKLEKAQAILDLKNLEHKIIFDVRDRVRDVRIQQRYVEVAKIAQEKEAENFEAQKSRYMNGQVSTHDMLDYHDKLSRAQLDYNRALVNYNLALINLEKAEGVTLERNNIVLEE